MRNTVIASAAVHVGLTLALLVVRPSHEVLVPGPDVVEVALVDPSAVGTPAPAAAPAPAHEAPPPLEERGVRIEKSQPKPARTPSEPRPQASAPVAPAAPTPAAPAAPARVVLPYAAMGGAMRGQVAVDESNFEFAYYLQQVRALIARNWSPTAGLPAGTRVEVYFRVSRDGSLTAPRIETSSGNSYFDDSAARAVIITGHLPPLPLGYAGSDLGIHFGFEYAGT